MQSPPSHDCRSETSFASTSAATLHTTVAEVAVPRFTATASRCHGLMLHASPDVAVAITPGAGAIVATRGLLPPREASPSPFAAASRAAPPTTHAMAAVGGQDAVLDAAAAQMEREAKLLACARKVASAEEQLCNVRRDAAAQALPANDENLAAPGGTVASAAAREQVAVLWAQRELSAARKLFNALLQLAATHGCSPADVVCTGELPMPRPPATFVRLHPWTAEAQLEAARAAAQQAQRDRPQRRTSGVAGRAPYSAWVIDGAAVRLVGLPKVFGDRLAADVAAHVARVLGWPARAYSIASKDDSATNTGILTLRCPDEAAAGACVALLAQYPVCFAVAPMPATTGEEDCSAAASAGSDERSASAGSDPGCVPPAPVLQVRWWFEGADSAVTPHPRAPRAKKSPPKCTVPPNE